MQIHFPLKSSMEKGHIGHGNVKIAAQEK